MKCGRKKWIKFGLCHGGINNSVEDHMDVDNCGTQSLSNITEEGITKGWVELWVSQGNHRGFQSGSDLWVEPWGGWWSLQMGGEERGTQEEGQSESRDRADGVLRKQWLGAWNVGVAVIQGAGVWWSWEARLSRWVGDTWTLFWMQICSEPNHHSRICGRGVPWSSFWLWILFLIAGLGWIGGMAHKCWETSWSLREQLLGNGMGEEGLSVMCWKRGWRDNSFWMPNLCPNTLLISST